MYCLKTGNEPSRHPVRPSRSEGRLHAGYNQFYAHFIAYILPQLLPPEENLTKSVPTEQDKIIADKHGRAG